jgi:LuxR family maltose regulon positive regulatory protein
VLVATKLYVPEVRPGMVPRRDLVARLVAGGERKLVLLCAPAGWGKTMLLSEWFASEEEVRPFAWVSLDRGDTDPVRFWSYVIEALRTIEPKLGKSALAALPAAGAGLVDAVVAPLVNDLAAAAQPLVLVLDDYHLVHADAVHASVAFLLRHLPPRVQVAIASRGDPPLPLASLRAASEITEVRAAALGFTDQEADALLNGSLGLDLDEGEVRLLRARTEGWAAGLRLAALSAQSHEDKHAFVEAFAGDDRQIGDYLHEVLADQPAALRDFLLRTSILERMCASLCEAVTGATDATELLAQCERSNLFLVPLDGRREWYRYHHLFRDLLRQELNGSEPAVAVKLHRRASAWHREQGNADEAIAHAAAAHEYDYAAELITANWRELLNKGEVATVARWLDALPRETVAASARLCGFRAWTELSRGHVREAIDWRRVWEDSLLAADDGKGAANASVIGFDAALAHWSGDVGLANEAGCKALSHADDGSDWNRASARVNLGEALYYAGEPASARAMLEEALLAVKDDDSMPALVAYGYLAAAHAVLGEIEQMEYALARAERLVDQLEVGELPWVAIVWIARGMVSEAGGDVASAQAAFERALVLARRSVWPLDRAHALLRVAGVQARRKDHTAARAHAREARKLLAGCVDPGRLLQELLAKTERSLQLTRRPATVPALPADVELSERELTILRLLAGELSQREIGSELFISLNTVKGHVRNVFRKLAVDNRAQAVARGREFGLI